MALALLTDRALADRISLRVWAAIDSSEGIFVAPTEQGDIGPDLFRTASGMGLGRFSVEAARTARNGPVEALDQGEELQAPSDEPGARRRFLIFHFIVLRLVSGPISVANWAISREPVVWIKIRQRAQP